VSCRAANESSRSCRRIPKLSVSTATMFKRETADNVSFSRSPHRFLSRYESAKAILEGVEEGGDLVFATCML
jgi:hypothetical protein